MQFKMVRVSNTPSFYLTNCNWRTGFGMDNQLAILLAYSTMLTDGNVVSNLMSIGQKTPLTGPDPPAPAIVGGLNTHGTFEGTL
jgi:hypothetical protein